MSYIIGIDIGGTNTDAVLINAQNKILATAKTATTKDIAGGFAQVLRKLFEQKEFLVSDVSGIFLGTTHATNAILQKQDLYSVGLIRIAGQQPDSLPAAYSWPTDLKETILAGERTIAGGFECDGRPISSFNSSEAREAIESLLESGAQSFAVVGVFSPMNPEQELETAEIIKKLCGQQFPITLSHQIGGVGFVERENTSLLNSALKNVMALGFNKLKKVCLEMELSCPLFVTQNNGSMITLEEAIENPILTISAGPTNSFIGASRLTGLRNALVIDIGGTSTDIGMIKNGFPRRSLNTSDIGGVKLNFSMPDVLSIAIGGGSYVEPSKVSIGPQSVGHEITTRAKAFGGDQLTLTDAAITAGHTALAGTIPDTHFLDVDQARDILDHAFKSIDAQLKVMQGEQTDLPVLLVGGGSSLLLPDSLEGNWKIPEFANVANAFGAALSEVAGEIDTIVSLANRDDVLSKIKQEAIHQAIQNGADSESTEIVDIQILPYHYVPNQMARVTVTAAGSRSLR